ncbi:hypothetical protein P168DRAFT_192722 [Aspergillus campestris IBT 28561]|uniref:Uncharacterized protein n=1 Tax=Aspergillus campestris (strain IBT 28561) TaxID=1392248 RepID=A0A2I1CYZ8_ASPC2|nr:uncharacterized protein P168DRAFT_192722 [Aspergillus campestris IBT 28561]PKY02859.1 hypothetical protein P168DRAFT_192722 [Aspergillus campestris IBT 28561]
MHEKSDPPFFLSFFFPFPFSSFFEDNYAPTFPHVRPWYHFLSVHFPLSSLSYHSHLSPLEGWGDDTVLLSLILVYSAFRSFYNFFFCLFFPFLFFSFPLLVTLAIQPQMTCKRFFLLCHD